MKPLQKGHVLNQQYTIQELIATGGNSYVYFVQHPHIGHLIIKEYVYGLSDHDEFLRKEDGSIDFLSDFYLQKNQSLALKEQNQLKTLREAGFVFYEAALQPFYENNTYYTPILNSMGTPLSNIKIQDVSELYHYTLILLKAIHQLHSKNFIHLDISPDNLLITPYDVGFLLDFGSMKSLDHLDNEISCKEAYASKEVLERVYYKDNLYFQSGDLGVWSDIYSIGKVMLEMEKKVEYQQLYTSELSFYHQVALKACKEKIKHRYQNIQEMMEELSKQEEHLHYHHYKMRESILQKAEALKNSYDQPSKNEFYYKNRNHLFVGREKEQQRLFDFQDQKKPFLYTTITAPAGSGKSALMYHYISTQLKEINHYRYVEMTGQELSQYDPMDLMRLGFDVFIVVDYVTGFYQEIATFLNKAKDVQGNYKLRLVFIERGQEHEKYPLWMEQLKPYVYHFDALIDPSIYLGDIYLHSLEEESLQKLLYLDTKKLQTIDPLCRPLYAVLLNQMAREEHLQSITSATDVLNYVISKEKKRIFDLCQEMHLNVDEWMLYYVKATFMGDLDFEEIDIALNDQTLHTILNKINTNDAKFKLHGLEPDLLGEYFILDYFSQCRNITIKNILNDVWQRNPSLVQRTLVNTELDFGSPHRSLLNFDKMYAPLIINNAYHDLLKSFLFISDINQEAKQLLKEHYEFYIHQGRWMEYHGNDSVIHVPNEVTSIGRIQGMNVSHIEEIYLGNSVERIEARAFFYHPNLKKIVTNNELKIIEEGAFQNCHQLTTVKLNEGLEIIEDNAFLQTSIHELNLPTTLKAIGTAAFNSTCFLDKLIIPQSVTHIGEYAFYKTHIKEIDFQANIERMPFQAFGFSELEKITLPEGLIVIDERAFYETKLQTIEFPSTVKYINDFAFCKNQSLTSIKFNPGCLHIGMHAFSYCRIENIVWPTVPLNIKEKAFFLSMKMERLVIPKNICTIPADCFAINGITHLVLEEGVEYIGANAFLTSPLAYIQFPSTLRYIGQRAFMDAKGLHHVDLNQGLKTIQIESFRYCPMLKVEIPESVIELNPFAFPEYTQVIQTKKEKIKTETKKEISLQQLNERLDLLLKEPEVLDNKTEERIFKPSMYHKEDLLEIDSSYTSVEGILFEPPLGPFMAGPRKVVLNEGLERILPYSFSKIQIKEIKIPSTTRIIEHHAFENCYDLEKVELSEGLKILGYDTFSGCRSLMELVLPQSLEAFHDHVIRRTKIRKLVFPKTIQRIGSICDTQLEEIIIPKNTALRSDEDTYRPIRVENNPNLKRIKLHHQDLQIGFFHLENNPKLEIFEVVYSKPIENVDLINQICELNHYPFKVTETSFIMDATKGNPTDLYYDFVTHGFIFQKVKEWQE